MFETPRRRRIYLREESLRISIRMPQNALTHHCFATELKLTITFYRRFWHIHTYTRTHMIYAIFSLQTLICVSIMFIVFIMFIMFILYCEVYFM